MTIATTAASMRSPVRFLAVLPILVLLAACQRIAPEPGTAAKSSAAQDDRVVLYYYDPMRPEVHFDEPGRSPFMDMPLVPRYAGAAAQSGVAVDASIVQTLGIRTEKPTIRDVRPSVRVTARVVANARGQVRMQARVTGWVERLIVRAVGQSVTAGDVVAEIYSPELVRAQEEMLLGAETAEPAAERLRRLGVAESDIQTIRLRGRAARRLPLRAPVGGIVTDLGVREGSNVSPDTLIVDLSSRNAVWVEAQLFPAQKLRLGNSLSARFTLPGVPGRLWSGEGGTTLPMADPVTQAVIVRFQIEDAGDLPFGTVLDARIAGDSRAGVLLVPAAAVIRTARGDRVIREVGANRFVPTPVTLGERYGDELEIVAGAAAIDCIVVSGQFLLDAESSLQSGLGRMAGGTP